MRIAHSIQPWMVVGIFFFGLVIVHFLPLYQGIDNINSAQLVNKEYITSQSILNGSRGLRNTPALKSNAALHPDPTSMAQRRLQLLAIVSRYSGDVHWLTQGSNLRTIIYQSAGQTEDGYPTFPGYNPVSPKANDTSTKVQHQLAWPDWIPRQQGKSSHCSQTNTTTTDIQCTSEIAAPPSLLSSSSLNTIPLRIVPNKGTEALGFLAAIVDHYDDLLATSILDRNRDKNNNSNNNNTIDMMLFLHDHRQSWHNLEFTQEWILKRLSKYGPSQSLSRGYSSLLCHESLHGHKNKFSLVNIDANAESPHGPRWHEATALWIRKAYKEVLEEYLGPAPDYVESPCCATFAVQAASIVKHPKEMYVKARDWVVNSREGEEGKFVGIAWEYLYHIMFTGENVFVAPQDDCLCEVYSVCSL